MQKQYTVQITIEKVVTAWRPQEAEDMVIEEFGLQPEDVVHTQAILFEDDTGWGENVDEEDALEELNFDSEDI